MARLAFFLLTFLVAGFSGCTSNPSAESDQQWQTFTATAYSVDGETSSGAQTREGQTVAADHNILPEGTVIEVRGADDLSGQYVVQDSGPKVKGNRIDIFVESGKRAKQFGRKNVEVRIVENPSR